MTIGPGNTGPAVEPAAGRALLKGLGVYLRTKIVLGYAVACGIAGAVPGGLPLWMVLEIGLVYHLSVAHRIPFRRVELAVIWAILMLASFILTLIIEAILAWFPGPDWVANGAIVFGFVMGAGWLVDSYYGAAERPKFGST